MQFQNIKSDSSQQSGSKQKCSVDVITSDESFDALEKDWNTLIENSVVHVYQTFEWMRTWWKYFKKPGQRVHILVFFVDGIIVGIAPFFKEGKKIFGIIPFNRLQFIGSGLSDYIDIIIRSGYEQTVIDSYFSYLKDHKHEWALVDAECVNENSHLMKCINQASRDQGLKIISLNGSSGLYFELPDSEEALMNNMGDTSRHNYKRKLKSFQQKHEGELRVLQHETDDIGGAVEIFSEIHGKRWKSLGFPSAFDEKHHREFHAEFSKKFAQRGWLKMFMLCAKSESIGVGYAFTFNKRIYLYQCNAFGSKEVMQCSPGILIRVLIMIDGVKNGMKVLDYLRGSEEYKSRETDVMETKNYFLRIFSPAKSKHITIYLFLFMELILKANDRTKREYYHYKRFTFTQPRSLKERVIYSLGKGNMLLKLGLSFFRSIILSMSEKKSERKVVK
jgi:CelD/BcsL family acetyltransferase involved in cellulose biosynthesis